MQIIQLYVTEIEKEREQKPLTLILVLQDIFVESNTNKPNIIKKYRAVNCTGYKREYADQKY